MSKKYEKALKNPVKEWPSIEAPITTAPESPRIVINGHCKSLHRSGREGSPVIGYEEAGWAVNVYLKVPGEKYDREEKHLARYCMDDSSVKRVENLVKALGGTYNDYLVILGLIRKVKEDAISAIYEAMAPEEDAVLIA